jgi:hypothetical protein
MQGFQVQKGVPPAEELIVLAASLDRIQRAAATILSALDLDG